MKLIGYAVLALMPLTLGAEEVALENEALSLTTGQHPEHLLSGLLDLQRDQQQLRQERKSAAPMFSGKSTGDKGGSRILFEKEGVETPAVWKVVEADGEGIVMESDNAEATTRFVLEENATTLRVTLEWGAGSAWNQSALRWEWMLEVGGDFFAVPTEGMADYQIYLTEDKEGARKIRFAPVERQGTGSFSLIAPWWAVSDRNRKTILLCRLAGNIGTPEVRQTSGNQGSADAFTQGIVLQPAGEPRRIEAKITLYSGLQFFNALGESTIYHLSKQGEELTLHAATSLPIPSGKLALMHAGRKVAEWPISDWSPREPLAFPVKAEEGDLPADRKECWLELSVAKEPVERIPLYLEEMP